jgi:hypothetical protein
VADRRTSREGRPSGAGIDAAPENRPGVPREVERRDSGAWWDRPEQQRPRDGASRDGLRRATPVFGTAQPPAGLSGAVRRAAYRIPEHRAARWALLLAADRVDVLEHRLGRSLWLLPAAIALVAGYGAASRALRR